MNIKNRYTGEVIYSGDFKDIKSLLIDAVSKGANLMGANLWGANLRGANLCGANLRNANLWGANLWGANLRDANLWGANLRGANLWGCAGNGNQIKSLFVSDIYPITYTSEYLQIGCERHLIADWWNFDNGKIANMDGKQALKFWGASKELIKTVIEAYPATPTNYVEKSSEAA